MLKKSFVTSIFIIIVLPLIASASMDKYLPNEKAWAVQFSIRDNFTLSSFDGSTISILKHTSLEKAWRYSLTIGANTSNTDDKDVVNNIRTSESETDQSSRNISVTALRMTYPNTAARVNLFYGFGPTVTYRSDKNETRRKIPADNYNRILTKTAWNLGGEIVLGVQYLVAKNFGLFAEYGSSLTYNYRRDKEETLSGTGDDRVYRIDIRDSKGISFSSLAVKFGLSVYF